MVIHLRPPDVALGPIFRSAIIFSTRRVADGDSVAPMSSWVPDAIFYAVLPDRLEPPRPEELAGYARDAFEAWDEPPAHRAYKGGTLRGVVQHLDRLAELGMPPDSRR